MLFTAGYILSIKDRGGKHINQVDMAGMITTKENRLNQFLDVGAHFDNSIYSERDHHQISLFRSLSISPRQNMIDKITILGI